MVLIVIIVVAYLVSTRIERSTSSVYANRLRAKIQADSGLAAAIHLLKDNTRYGNYITAMPAPSPLPASIYTEIYRPTDPADSTHALKADDYLRLDNAAGEILVSRVNPSTSPGPDPRPTPEPIPAALPTPSPFTVTAPTFSANSSYDFNQTVTVGSAAGRLVQPSPSPAPPPAYGEWVNVRDTNSQVIGRYAFFIEDESMKVNVNYAGNNVGGSNMRVNDLSTPLPASTPASQIQEIDPSAILPAAANRLTANTNLNNVGNAGSRLSTRLTLGLLGEWSSVANAFPNYAHLATALSEDDNTTARGWQRLDLNALTAGIAGNVAKKAAATKIANWIRDAWTGSTSIANLQDYQMLGDDWLRQQIGANIVDYITPDNTPTDMGDVIPSGFGLAVPVIGLKKMPYLSGVNIVYQASGSTYPGSGSGAFTATMKMKMQFQFLNLYDTALDLKNAMGSNPQSRIEVKGVPIVQKNGSTVYDVSSQTWTIKLSDLTAVKPPADTMVPAGSDGTSTSGARTFQTDWLDTQTVSFTVAATETGSTKNPKFLAGSTTIKWIGNQSGDYRIDDTAMVNSATTTKWCNTCGGSPGDFLKESNSTTKQIAAISYIAGYQGTITFGNSPGDPRYRGRLVSDRWNFDNSRTDADPSDASNKLDALVDSVDINCRPYGFDWFDYSGDRPLAFIRNGPMINVGELGNVAACEYPWRTLYFQYPERPANSSASGSPATEIPQRRSHSLDYILADLFRMQSAQTRSGAININTQQTLGIQQRAVGPLFLGVPVGTQNISQTAPNSLDRIDNDPGSPLAASISSRRILLATPFLDNGPIRPFFQSGELASVLSRLVNNSPGGSGTTSDSRGGCSTVSYGVLRNSATTASEKVSGKVNANIQRDMQVEQLFREVSNSITTRGNIFRVLYVGQTLKNGLVQAEYLGEAFVKRTSVFTPDSSNPDIVRTSDSTYKLLANRVITE